MTFKQQVRVIFTSGRPLILVLFWLQIVCPNIKYFVLLVTGLQHRITGDLSSWVVSKWCLWVWDFVFFFQTSTEHLPVWTSVKALDLFDDCPCFQTPFESAFNCFFPLLFFFWMNDKQSCPVGTMFSYLLLRSAKKDSICWLPLCISTRHQFLFMTKFIHNLSGSTKFRSFFSLYILSDDPMIVV